MAQALYRKWRPQTFDDMVGQQHVVRTLRNALRSGHIHHAYLFAGPRGTGKTSTARLVAKAVNCLAPVEERPCNQCEICQAVVAGRLMDLIEIDAASNTGVDNVRDILEKVGFRPAQARYKVYVVDEVHMLSTAAFNALLKTLEEPPEHVIFVLATTEAHKIPPTVLSRCQRFEFRRIPLEAIVNRLQKITEAEGYQAEPEALELIARASTGSLRDGISLLDQMAADGSVTADYVRQMLGAERREVVQTLAQAWLDKDMQQGVETINRAIDGGADPRQLARQTSDFLRGLLLMRLGAGSTWTDPTEEERPHFEEMARQAETDRLVDAVRHFSEVSMQGHTSWQPQLPLELAFVEATLSPEPRPQEQKAETASPKPPVQKPAAAQRPEKRSYARPARSTSPPAKPKVNERQAAPPATPSAPPSASGDLPSIDKIADRWRDILKQMRKLDQFRTLAAFLHGARPAGTDAQGNLVLGFRHAFHRNKVDNETNRPLVEQYLSQALNTPVRVTCVLEKDLQSVLAPEETQSSSQSNDQKKSAGGKAASTPPPPDPPTEGWEEKEIIQRAQKELGAVPKVQNAE